MPETKHRPMPVWHMDGIPNLGRRVQWLTFDAVKGILICTSSHREFTELLCVIVHACQVRTFTVPGGRVICASEDRETANHGRLGKECSSCEERNNPCRLRWRLWMQEVETEAIFAHTLSVTASASFVKYADALQNRGHLPGEVVTNIFIEDFERKRTGLSYRSLLFDCASP